MSDTTAPNWLNRDIYPFSPHYYQTSAGRMHYVDEGQGQPVVMVHGNPSWSFEHRDLIKALSPDFRCIAPDHIGFGLSDKPINWTYLPEEQAVNFEIFMESLDLQEVTLVVGDWGGPIGISYAIRHPERIKALVITNTWLWSVKRDWYYQMFSGFMGGRIGRTLIRRYNFFAGTMVRTIFGDKSKLTEEVHRHYLMPFENVEERKGSWVFPYHIIESSEWLDELWSLRESLIGKPMLLAWGMKDIAFREKELKQWASAFPGAKIVRYPAAGHFVAEEQAGALAAEIRALLA